MEALDKAHEFLTEIESYQIDLEKWNHSKSYDAPSKPQADYIIGNKSIFMYILETL